MPITTTVTYRKMQSGRWVAYGPADQLVAQQYADVVKRDGTVKREWIDRVGKKFQVDGSEYRYGYIGRHQIHAYARCRACGGNGAVEQGLETCQACGRDFDC